MMFKITGLLWNFSEIYSTYTVEKQQLTVAVLRYILQQLYYVHLTAAALGISYSSCIKVYLTAAVLGISYSSCIRYILQQLY